MIFVTCGAATFTARDDHQVSHLAASIAGGLVVTVMIYSVGHISGAHMNPTITFAFAAFNHFPRGYVQCVLAYWVAQLVGSTLASHTLRWLLDVKDVGVTKPTGSVGQAFGMEIIVAFCMMLLASAVSIDTTTVYTTKK
ncbi:LOW QUALITY PROTEIN: hypothetical protein M8C21_017191 [Ambrosia artemisiifolia]|uniref:Uncharacterized protein n=1 Tax=Ambrosia artemisiifolia TaxID=4212 RepID=A0AAD5BST9_AMBAR|nr:LOW QUALITY PROTEIN: hypothetical protein M8C21_017191 [Ambrosia artemisiifolia]